MATIISKEEFLKACNLKLKKDQSDKADEERRRREEEERRRREEEERRRREEEERRRREEEERRRQEEEGRKRKANAEWDAWYNSLPTSCKNGFVWNNFQYSVNKSSRTVTKTPLLGDPRGKIGIDPRYLRDIRTRDDVRANVRFSGFINEELGLI
jgi:hypothetical protein